MVSKGTCTSTCQAKARKDGRRDMDQLGIQNHWPPLLLPLNENMQVLLWHMRLFVWHLAYEPLKHLVSVVNGSRRYHQYRHPTIMGLLHRHSTKSSLSLCVCRIRDCDIQADIANCCRRSCDLGRQALSKVGFPQACQANVIDIELQP